MRVIIIAGGTFSPCIEFLKDDYIICADSGFDNAREFGIKPNLMLGDMDSVKSDVSSVKDMQLFPARKDFTDTELALNAAIDMKPQEIIILGGIGSRLDHSIANVFLLKKAYAAGVSACICDEHNRVYYYKDEFCLTDCLGKTVSLIPLTSEISGLVTKGLDYPLDNEKISFGQTRGISNLVTEKEASYRSESGEGILVISDGI